MMKKILVLWVACAMTLLVGINVVNGALGDMKDKELMNRYVRENYGEQCYGVLCPNEAGDKNDEYVEIEVYQNGVLRYNVSFDREYYQNLYND